MASEKDTPATAQTVNIPLEQAHPASNDLEKAHTASHEHKAHTASEAHFSHMADAHRGQPAEMTAQALVQALGGFPNVGSAISDPNAAPQVQATASNNAPDTTGEPAKG